MALTYIDVVLDVATAEEDGAPEGGQIEFIPDRVVLDTDGNRVLERVPIVRAIGATVSLVATDSAGLASEFRYLVRNKVIGAPVYQRLVAIPRTTPGGTAHLSDLLPVEAAPQGFDYVLQSEFDDLLLRLGELVTPREFLLGLTRWRTPTNRDFQSSTTAAFQVVDEANAVVSFTGPDSGRVAVSVCVPMWGGSSSSATVPRASLGLMDAAGAIVGTAQPAQADQTLNVRRALIVVGGVASGVLHHWRLGFKPEAGVTTLVKLGPDYGELVMAAAAA